VLTSATGIIIHTEEPFVKGFFIIFFCKFFTTKTPVFSTTFCMISNFLKQSPDILRCEGVSLVTELALDRKCFSFLQDLCQFLSAQADQGAGYPLP